MRRTLLALLAATCALANAADQQPKPTTHEVRNIASAFTEFWDATQDMPTPQRVEEFKRRVLPRSPEFYGIERFGEGFTQARRDEHIAKAIEGFPAIRAEYVKKASQFEAELPRYVASFKTRFPDYRQNEDIYVLHSLGEMDGGSRNLGGRMPLIFGVDGMVLYHGKGNETPFFHHELFHSYHSAMDECDGKGVWVSLWQEGLATYVSKVMNPGASDAELLLEIPNKMATRTREVLPAAFEHLETVLDSTDQEVYKELFQSRGTSTLPTRRGYYLGALVAEEAGKTRSLMELAKLQCPAVRELVFATVRTLRNRYAKQ